MANPNIGEILKSKSPEERKAIALKSGETRRENNAMSSRYKKKLEAIIKQKIRTPNGWCTQEDIMLAHLVEIAAEGKGKDAILAFQEIRDVLGDTTKQQQMASINIDTNAINIIFSDDIKKLSN